MIGRNKLGQVLVTLLKGRRLKECEKQLILMNIASYSFAVRVAPITTTAVVAHPRTTYNL
jgi:hypothetical protein